MREWVCWSEFKHSPHNLHTMQMKIYNVMTVCGKLFVFFLFLITIFFFLWHRLIRLTLSEPFLLWKILASVDEHLILNDMLEKNVHSLFRVNDQHGFLMNGSQKPHGSRKSNDLSCRGKINFVDGRFRHIFFRLPQRETKNRKRILPDFWLSRVSRFVNEYRETA